MCHHLLRNASKLALGFTSLGLVLSVALVGGCDSPSVDPNSPEVQQAAAASRAKSDKADEEATAAIKKRGGKNAATLKSGFKGGRGANITPAGDAKPE